jgi:hypothetical protein
VIGPAGVGVEVGNVVEVVDDAGVCTSIFFQILDGLTGGVGLSAKAHFNSSATGADSLNEAYTYVYRT